MNVSRVSPRVLVADDQPDVREALRLLLKAEGYSTEAVDNPNAIVKAVEGQDFDLLLMDLNYARDTTSGREGLDLLERLHDVDDTLPVVVMTARGSVELTLEAMRSGARDLRAKAVGTTRVFSAFCGLRSSSAKRFVAETGSSARTSSSSKTRRSSLPIPLR